MQGAIAIRAEAKRRSVVIAAEGTIALSYLQAPRRIATKKNSTTIFPVPMHLLQPFLEPRKDH